VIIEHLGPWTALETLVLEEPTGNRFIDLQILGSLKTSKEADLKRRWRRSRMDTAKVPTITWAVNLSTSYGTAKVGGNHTFHTHVRLCETHLDNFKRESLLPTDMG
jgi:hypothetical protein